MPTWQQLLGAKGKTTTSQSHSDCFLLSTPRGFSHTVPRGQSGGLPLPGLGQSRALPGAAALLCSPALWGPAQDALTQSAPEGLRGNKGSWGTSSPCSRPALPGSAGPSRLGWGVALLPDTRCPLRSGL